MMASNTLENWCIQKNRQLSISWSEK